MSDKNLYFVKSGNVILSTTDNQIKTYSTGECLNLVSCLFELKIVSSLEVNEEINIISISKKDLSVILGSQFDERIIKNFFNKSIESSFNKTLQMLNIKKYFNFFNLKLYEKSSIVFSNLRNINQKLVFIIHGSIENQSTKEIIASEGELFGFSLLNKEENLNYKIISTSKLITLEVKWCNLVKNIPNNSHISLNIYNTIRQLKKNYLINVIDEFKLTIICSKLKSVNYETNSIICVEKEISNDCVYFIVSGRVKVYKNNELERVLDENSIFNESVLLCNNDSHEVFAKLKNDNNQNNMNINKNCCDDTVGTLQENSNKYCLNSHTVKSCTKVHLYKIEKQIIYSILDSNQLENLRMRIGLLNCNVNLSNLNIVKELGRGKFGQVYLTQYKKFFYALKCILKENVIENSKLRYYLHKERQIMMEFDHPFIVKLAKSFQTSKHVFFLMENIEGISMSEFLRTRSGLYLHNNELTSFYASLLILVIEYLNRNSYAHRDIKPENIILSKNGYLKLIDFGVSKKIKGFTKSLVGTPHYLAPEIILGEEYNFSVDYWSMGICLYEIFYGYFPFGNMANSPQVIYNEVINK